jgi:hypothetical protein
VAKWPLASRAQESECVRQIGVLKPTSAPVHASSNDCCRGEGRMKVDVTIVHGAPEGWFLPGNGKVEWFQDYDGGLKWSSCRRAGS